MMEFNEYSIFLSISQNAVLKKCLIILQTYNLRIRCVKANSGIHKIIITRLDSLRMYCTSLRHPQDFKDLRKRSRDSRDLLPKCRVEILPIGRLQNLPSHVLFVKKDFTFRDKICLLNTVTDNNCLRIYLNFPNDRINN